MRWFYIDYIISFPYVHVIVSLNNCNTNPVVIGDVSLNKLLYADDIVLLSESKEGLQICLDELYKFKRLSVLNLKVKRGPLTLRSCGKYFSHIMDGNKLNNKSKWVWKGGKIWLLLKKISFETVRFYKGFYTCLGSGIVHTEGVLSSCDKTVSQNTNINMMHCMAISFN